MRLPWFHTKNPRPVLFVDINPCPHGGRYEPTFVRPCGKPGSKDGAPFTPDGGNIENQYWVCPDGHRWTSGRFLTPEHPFRDDENDASHLIGKHALMVSVYATQESVRETHRRAHA